MAEDVQINWGKVKNIFESVAERMGQNPDRPAIGAPKAKVRVLKERLFEATTEGTPSKSMNRWNAVAPAWRLRQWPILLQERQLASPAISPKVLDFWKPITPRSRLKLPCSGIITASSKWRIWIKPRSASFLVFTWNQMSLKKSLSNC